MPSVTNKDQVAFLTEAYRKFAPLVHARARRMVGHDAEDVVQDVFIRLMKSQPDPQKIASWIYTTATNLCMDRLRHRLRRDSAWRKNLQHHVTAKSKVDAQGVIADREQCRLLLGLVDQDTQRAAMLVYLDGMTRQEAADQLGVSRKTLTNRLQRFVDKAQKTVDQWNS